MQTKSGLRRQFKTNKQQEQQGVWMELPEATNADGTVPAFLIKRVGTFNVEHSLEVERLTAKFAGRKMTQEEAVETTKAAFIKCGMSDWRHVQNDNGEELGYNTTLCTELFNDMPDLYEKAVVFGNKMDNYKEGALESDVKN